MGRKYQTNLSQETTAIHADRQENKTSSVAPPIFQTANYKAKSPEEFADAATSVRHEQFYTRYGNPTRGQAEKLISTLEGSESAMLTASGMGAISTAVLSLVSQGDHVIGQQNHYGGTTALLRDILPRFGIETTFVDQTAPAQFELAIRPSTKLIVLESPSNPLMRLTDLAAVAKIAKEHGILTIADNTFASPINQRPAELGIDLIAHSATKYLGGHSDVIAGALTGSAELLNKIWDTYIVLGTALSPFDSWLVARGVRTLSLRVNKQNQTALAIARFLESHPKVKQVYYPGLESHPQHELARQQMSGYTGILSFEIEGGIETADRFIASLELAACAASLGGIETLVVRPAAMLSHQISEEEFSKIGISRDLIRLSVGIEGEEDLICDIEQALMSIY